MESAKAGDCYGLLPGHSCQQADGERAYTQALFKGTSTWIELPCHRWPKEWVLKRFVRPVSPLLLALYGHADSGGYWELHCEAHLLSVGFTKVD